MAHCLLHIATGDDATYRSACENNSIRGNSPLEDWGITNTSYHNWDITPSTRTLSLRETAFTFFFSEIHVHWTLFMCIFAGRNFMR